MNVYGSSFPIYFTCSGYGPDCHLLVPFNFQVALILDLKCFLFLIQIISYPQESSPTLFHLWDSVIISPKRLPQSCLRASKLEVC